MNIKTRYKKLGLRFPFTLDKDFWEECVEESNRINPVFNSNGFYYDRLTQKVWLEINGEAWYYNNKAHFLYDLNLETAKQNRLHKDVINAIEILQKYRFVSKRQSDLLHWEYNVQMIRKVHLDSRLHAISILKKFKNR